MENCFLLACCTLWDIGPGQVGLLVFHNYQQVGHIGFKEGWMGFPALSITEERGGNIVSKVDCNNRFVGLWSLSYSWVLLMKR